MRPLALLLILTLAKSAFASPAFASTGVPALDFAEHMSAIEPAFAALEIERFLDLNPNHPQAEFARERLVSLYLAQKDWLKAQRHLQTLLAKAPAGSQARWSLQLAHLQELKGWPDLARSEYERLAVMPGVEASALRHLLGLEIRARRWNAATQAAERLPSTPQSQALTASLRAWRDRPSLSADHAQRLSMWLPGAGQIYAGDWGSGIASFTLNAAWVGLLSYAIADRDWLGGLLVANFGPRYYLGGIQNAGNLVENTHAREDQAFIRSLEQEYADLFPLK
ncbi:hypothetical protein D3C87_1216280 [compost metagenome]